MYRTELKNKNVLVLIYPDGKIVEIRRVLSLNKTGSMFLSYQKSMLDGLELSSKHLIQAAINQPSESTFKDLIFLEDFIKKTLNDNRKPKEDALNRVDYSLDDLKHKNKF